MGQMHVVTAKAEAKVFVERYAESLRAAIANQAVPPGTPQRFLRQDHHILWWAPDKVFIRSLDNPWMLQSSEPDDAFWDDISSGDLPLGSCDIVVIDNELIFHGTVANQVRNKANQLRQTITNAHPSLSVILLIDKTMRELGSAEVERTADVVLHARNQHVATVLKHREKKFPNNRVVLP